MAAVGGCGCAGMGSAMPNPGGSPVQGNPIAEAVARRYEVPIDTSSTESMFQTFDSVLEMRKRRVADIKAAIEQDAQATGTPNAMALQQVRLEEQVNEQLAGVRDKFASVAQHMTQQDRDAVVAFVKETSQRGSVDPVSLMNAYIPPAQRAGLLNQPAIDALRGALQLVGAQQQRLTDMSTQIARDASTRGSVNPTALQQLEQETARFRELNVAASGLQKVGTTMTAEQSQQVLAAVGQAQQSGTTEQLVAVLREVAG